MLIDFLNISGNQGKVILAFPETFLESYTFLVTWFSLFIRFGFKFRYKVSTTSAGGNYPF